jgi:hypothetical protein
VLKNNSIFICNTAKHYRRGDDDDFVHC